MTFLDPLERMAFQMAIRNRHSEFKTKNGLTLTLNYGRKEGKVWFKTTKGFAPCGWLDTSTVLESAWVRS